MSNFRKYGQMKKPRWEESEKRREEERRSEKRKTQKTEDAGARKTLYFANDLWFWRVDKWAHQTSGRGAAWGDER